MGSEVSVPGIEYRKLQRVDYAADGIEDSTGQEPVKRTSRKIRKKRGKCCHTGPSHSDIENGGKPFRASDPEHLDQDPRNGNIICRCEVVTEAEIRRSIRRPVGARSVDGVKRRTRAGMGRCQGGFCMPRVAAILAEELGIPLLEVTKNGGDSRLLADTVERFLEGGHGHEH